VHVASINLGELSMNKQNNSSLTHVVGHINARKWK